MNTFAPRAGRTALLASLLLALLCPPAARAQASPQAAPPSPAAAQPATSAAPAAAPILFAFSYAKGDKFRVLSEVDEEVYIDRRLSHRAEILNRIAFEVADAAHDGSSGRLEGSFVTSERQVGASAFVVSESYDSAFVRDSRGRYTIGPEYFMPVVRNVPVFPDRALLPGDTWTAPGEERHDLRRVFGIPDPYAIPFEARYRYEGPVLREGRKLELVSCSYTVFHQPPPPRAYDFIYPTEIAGYSEQKIYWDPALGQPAAYEERFKLVFDWSDGRRIEYRGTAKAQVLEAELMDRAALAAEVAKAVEGLENVSVAQTAEGVSISIEDIRFQPDSARLLPAELDKIARIAEILKRYPGRDILVAGHTALAGTAEGRKLLSEERARAVAERLIASGARVAERIQVAGYGAERPVADNATEAGKARNRRVEIVILEN
ncbi:MAG TPA: OmpA family protein [Spirochaetales bacterium]|nr:OmpA family protein [Spirochaetales bacterium]